MPEKDPANYALVTYLWVAILSAWGGLASFIQKHRTGKTRAFNVMELVGELVISSLAGLLTFYMCEYAEIDRLLEAVFVAISGHMGARAIAQFEQYLMRRFPVPAEPHQHIRAQDIDKDAPR